MLRPIKGLGANLKTFEQIATYVSYDETTVDNDGYVRGGAREDADLKVAVVENPEEEYDVDSLGDNIVGVANIYVRSEGQGLNIDLEVGDRFIIDGVGWKILQVSDFDTVVKCACGRMESGGVSAVG